MKQLDATASSILARTFSEISLPLLSGRPYDQVRIAKNGASKFASIAFSSIHQSVSEAQESVVETQRLHGRPCSFVLHFDTALCKPYWI